MRAACLLGVVLLLAGAAFGEEHVYRAVVNDAGIQRIEMIGGGYYFFPNHLIVKVNVPVELVVRKEPGLVPHDIAAKSPEAGIDFSESLEKESKIIRFTPTRTGKYPFYCSKKLLFFPSHREEGMEGTIEVVP